MYTLPLEYGKFYHLYNRGINRCNLFQENENYRYFLHLYDKYISPVADTYAWVLMKNHFHFLVRIKGEEEINLTFFQDLQGFKDLEGLTRINKQFSNLFNAYTKAVNKRYLRTGSLFEHPFRRIRVNHVNHLKHLVYYIHHNPVHHGFCESMFDYPWSSFLSVPSPQKSQLKRKEVLAWFDGSDEFNRYHRRQNILEDSFLHIDAPNSYLRGSDK